MAWLPGLQTGRGEPMSVISDTEVRGDLILEKINMTIMSNEQHCADNDIHWNQSKTHHLFHITRLSFLLAFILALSNVRGLSLVQQLKGEGGGAACCCDDDAGEWIGGGGIDVSQCWGEGAIKSSWAKFESIATQHLFYATTCKNFLKAPEEAGRLRKQHLWTQVRLKEATDPVENTFLRRRKS